MLAIRDLHVHYGHAHILHGISLKMGHLPLAVVGRNGMGKTTLCKAIMGMTAISGGEILLADQRIDRLDARLVAKKGVAIVPQGRRVFPSLSVDEHLRLVARRNDAPWTIDRVYATFPRLAQRRSNGGTQLSGGEQQMLAIARALLMNPRLVVMDEPSEGLAPMLVEQLVEVLRGLSADGIGLLLIEQNLDVAAAVAESAAIMVNGRIAAVARTASLLNDEELRYRYLGVSSATHLPSQTHHNVEGAPQ